MINPIDLMNEYIIDKKYRPLLKKRYSRNRHYHDIAHLSFMYNECLKFYGYVTQSMILKIVYHDAVYNSKRKDNEQRSVELFKDHYLNSCETDAEYDYRFMNDVCKFIWSTEDHVLYMNNNIMSHEAVENQLLRDIDLAAMADRDSFIRNGELIRKEYKHLSGVEFNKGRKLFFEKLLSAPKIFGILRDLEDSTRENISNYLKS